ncbi:hypothetical protein BS78_10G077600 [Paspalum vaginatum]|nr:hypothetical protein BS78_10G077600 [Paspalum vaginatum]
MDHPSPGAITFSNSMRSSTPRSASSDQRSCPRPARVSFNHRLRPRAVHRCAEMIPEAYERKKRLEESALVVEDKGKCLVRDVEEVKELLLRAFGIIGRRVSVHRAYYTKFLVYFESKADKARVEQRGYIRMGSNHLTFEPWDFGTYGGPDPFPYHCTFSLEGLPEHAWHVYYAQLILGDVGVVHCLEENTKKGNNLNVFKFSAWVKDPHKIPIKCFLSIADPSVGGVSEFDLPYKRARKIKDGRIYVIFVHVDSIEDLAFYHFESDDPSMHRRVHYREFTWHSHISDGEGNGGDYSSPDINECRMRNHPRKREDDDDEEDRWSRGPRAKHLTEKLGGKSLEHPRLGKELAVEAATTTGVSPPTLGTGRETPFRDMKNTAPRNGGSLSPRISRSHP